MVVNQLMALLLPGIVYLNTYEKLFKKEINREDGIRKYFTGTLIINMIVYLIVIYVLKTPLFIFTNQFTLKYLALGIISAVVFAIIEKFVKTNIDVEIEVEHNNEKKN